MSAEQQVSQSRVIFLAPTRKDAALSHRVFEGAGIDCFCCDSLAHVVAELDRGAGALILPEEAAGTEREPVLRAWLSSQQPWSDLPVLVLARPGADSAEVSRAMDVLGNVTVIERPTRVTALVSATRAALRARDRQYQIRDYLEERQRSAELLTQQVEEMQTLLQTLPIGVFIAHDAACNLITGNRSASELLRMPEGANLSKSAPPGQQPHAFRVFKDGFEVEPGALPLQRAARGEEIHDEALDQVFPDGTILHTLMSARPLVSSAGHYRGAVGAIVDVTALRRTETALREADRRKDEFLAILAHELRNPLAPIGNSVGILRRMVDVPPAVHTVTGILERQVSHMVRLVDDLLEVSRITRGTIELRKEDISLRAVLDSAVEASRPLFEAARHEFQLVTPDTDVTLRADPVRLSQVISNLLNNAAKYTDPGGRISLTVTRNDSKVSLAVADNGSGIEPEVLPRIFDLFTQAARDTDRTQGGLGIGLTLVQRLVELHGGRIEARSDGPGRGSTFIVHLPLPAVPAPAPGLAPDREALPVMARQRILVVDDNRDSADSLSQLLRLTGAETCVVYSGPDALAAADGFHPTVALLDIGMPGMDGREVARRLRSRPDLEGLRLVALSGWGQESDVRLSEAAGFDHHLIKPPDLDELLRVIQRH